MGVLGVDMGCWMVNGTGHLVTGEIKHLTGLVIS